MENKENTVRGFFLDDWRWPKDVEKTMPYPPGIQWRRMKTPVDFECWLEFALDEAVEWPEFISFDYELNFREKTKDGKMVEKTGLDCLRFLLAFIEKHNKEVPELFFHSSDYECNRKMRECFEMWKAHRKPVTKGENNEC